MVAAPIETSLAASLATEPEISALCLPSLGTSAIVASTLPVASTSNSAAAVVMLGEASFSVPVSNPWPSCTTSPLIRVGPASKRNPLSRLVVALTATSPPSATRNRSRNASPLSWPVSVPSSANCPVKPNAASDSVLPASAPLGTLAATSSAMTPLPLAVPVSVSAPLAWSETSARSARAALKVKSAAPVAKVPSAAICTLSLAMRNASASSPAAVRATRPLSFTVPSSTWSSAGSESARLSAVPSSFRLKPPISGLTVPVAVRCMAPSRSRPATPENGAIELVSIATCPSNTLSSILPAAPRLSALPTRRNCASCSGSPAFHSPASPSPALSPSAACTSASSDAMPWTMPSALKVSRRFAGLSRLLAMPFPRSVTSFALSPPLAKPLATRSADQSSLPAPPKSTFSVARSMLVAAPGTGRMTRSPEGSAMVAARLRRPRKPSAVVAAEASSPSCPPLSFNPEISTPPAERTSAVALSEVWAPKNGW